MKHFTAVALTSLLAAESVTAHYIFQQLSVGGTKYPVFDYIRKNSNYNSPVTDLASNDLRCNEGASGATTSTVAVQAGSSFTFTLDTPVYHQGPISLYMSKAPGSAKDYDGSGDWFKIKDWGPSFSGGQASWPMEGSYTFNVPSCIADGEYLLRIQSLGIHNPWPAGIPQFYISCSQIKVTGGGSTSPSNTVKIPGFIKESDPGYTANIYSNFNSYTVPGPSVFTCSGGGNSGSPAPPTTTLVTRTTTAPEPTAAPGGGGGCSAAKFAQCGGIGFTGCTSCAAGSTCSKTNDWCMLSSPHSQSRDQILTESY